VPQSSCGGQLSALDLRDWNNPASRPMFTEALRDAAHRDGVFYLTGHGIAHHRIDEFFALIHRFFTVPREELLTADKIHSPHFRGYTPLGHEFTGGHRDWREMFDYGREQQPCPVRPGDPLWVRLVGPNQWPASVTEPRGPLLSWQEEIFGIGQILLQALAVALDWPADAFDELYGEHAHPTTKLVHYHARPNPDYDQGIGAHKDHGILTIVLQDTQGGLQAAKRNGDWLDITPLSGTLVVNIGEMLEFATGGYLLAPQHRVVAPTTGTTRTSAIVFINPRLAADIKTLPLPIYLADEMPELIEDPTNPFFTTYGNNALKRWARSHPEVVDRHYPELAQPHTELK
jgi:isopenicillin N synthase-like dioxygenase